MGHNAKPHLFKNSNPGAGEMAYQVRELVALTEDPDLISRTDMVIHNHL